jgi:hypothetical protein
MTARETTGSWSEISQRLARLETLLETGHTAAACGLPNALAVAACPHKRRLQTALLETIQILEETKKAFRSRALEQLRVKLTRELAEIA